MYGYGSNLNYFFLYEKSILKTKKFCSKGTLFRILTAAPNEKDWSIFNWEKVFLMLTDITQGLVYLHSRQPQIVHRDLKTLNLLVKKNK